MRRIKIEEDVPGRVLEQPLAQNLVAQSAATDDSPDVGRRCRITVVTVISAPGVVDRRWRIGERRPAAVGGFAGGTRQPSERFRDARDFLVQPTKAKRIIVATGLVERC